MMLAPLLLLAASAQLPTTEKSPLVTSDTVHDWVLISEDDDGAGWYDRNFQDSILFDGQRYPVILVRLSGEGINSFDDMLLAVDCTEKQMAVAATWVENEDEIRARYAGQGSMTLNFVVPPIDDGAIILFRQACGEGWKP